MINCVLLASTPKHLARNDAQLRELYGSHILTSRPDPDTTMIHLDNPDQEEIEKRVREFNRDSLFEDNCPICQMIRAEHCEVVYGNTAEE